MLQIFEWEQNYNIFRVWGFVWLLKRKFRCRPRPLSSREPSQSSLQAWVTHAQAPEDWDRIPWICSPACHRTHMPGQESKTTGFCQTAAELDCPAPACGLSCVAQTCLQPNRPDLGSQPQGSHRKSYVPRLPSCFRRGPWAFSFCLAKPKVFSFKRKELEAGLLSSTANTCSVFWVFKTFLTWGLDY